MSWIDIGALDEVPVRGARKLKTQVGCVAVFRTGEDQVYALENSCPHKQGPLSEGIVHGKTVTCPLHNWVISLETGLVQGPDEGSVDTYAVRVDGGRLLINASRFAAIAAE